MLSHCGGGRVRWPRELNALQIEKNFTNLITHAPQMLTTQPNVCCQTEEEGLHHM